MISYDVASDNCHLNQLYQRVFSPCLNLIIYYMTWRAISARPWWLEFPAIATSRQQVAPSPSPAPSARFDSTRAYQAHFCGALRANLHLRLGVVRDALNAIRQGLTLVHCSAQRKHF